MLVTSNRIILSIVVVGVAASWFILSRIRRRARKERYWNAKTPMPDEQFLAALHIDRDDHRKFCLAVRRAISQTMNVCPELIHPSDSLNALMDLRDPVNPSVGSSVMENDLALRVEHDFMMIQEMEGTGSFESSKTVADYLGYYLKNWDTICSHPERSF